MKVDTGWFNDLIRKSSYGSQRRLARRIKGRHGKPLDPAAISLMLRGKRAMQLFEARQFADLLDVPLIEVLKHSGLAMPEEGAREYLIYGTLDKEATLHIASSKETISGPAGLSSDAIAVRVRTSRSEHDMIDGWVLFAEKPAPLSSAALGRFSLVGPKKAKPVCGFVQRGYRAGTANLMCGFFSGPLEPHENVVLDWVAPVVWVRPQQ